jgi:hypothetical protein
MNRGEHSKNSVAKEHDIVYTGSDEMFERLVKKKNTKIQTIMVTFQDI